MKNKLDLTMLFPGIKGKDQTELNSIFQRGENVLTLKILPHKITSITILENVAHRYRQSIVCLMSLFFMTKS